MTQQRGCIISKKYEAVNTEEVKSCYVDLTKPFADTNNKTYIKIKIIDGIIMFDEQKSHIKNCEQILHHYYGINKEFSYDDMWFLKQNVNSLDGKEMYYANLLASLGEPTVLYGDCEDENKQPLKSTMLFLPKDMSQLTTKQIYQISEIIVNRDEHFFGAALCDGLMENLKIKDKAEIIKELSEIKNFNIHSR